MTAAALLACPMAPGAAGQDAGYGDDAAASATQQQIDEEISLNPYGKRDWWLRDYPMPAPYHSAVVGRFGYWATSVEGNESIIGLYQDLDPSPFWDFDGISSDGFSTVDFSISQLTETGFNGDLYYYRPGLSVDVDFDRYLKRLENTPLEGFHTEGGRFPVFTNELILDEDMAIRVEEIDAKFDGQLTKNVRWHFNFYNLHRHGQRQVTSLAHCFQQAATGTDPARANLCHLSNQSQRIDWNVAQFEPGVEGTWGPITVNYTREMKVFSSDDETVTRTFNNFSQFARFPDAPVNPGFRDVPMAVGLVPENFTQFDKIKLRTELTDKTSFYAFGYIGETENQFRDFERDYWGYDLRLISQISRGFSVTGYFKETSQRAGNPPELREDLGEPIARVQTAGPAGLPVGTPLQTLGGTFGNDIRSNVDYNRTQTGLRGAWKPYEYLCFGPLSGVIVSSGYEYSQISREDVTYGIGASDRPAEIGTGLRNPGTLFTIKDTQENMMYFDVSKRWNPQWNTFVRYKLRIIDDPLIGLRLYDEPFQETPQHTETFSNSNLPENVNTVEIGGTWMPAENLILTAQAGIENREHSSIHADFDEQSYPMTFTAWYGATSKWSWSAGAGYYNSFIDQDITVGAFEIPGLELFTTNWDYDARTQVYNIGTRYAFTNRLSLNGNIEWLRGVNVFNAPTPPGDDLEVAEDVAGIIVEQTRFTLGADYVIGPRITAFTRYIFLDFEDIDDGWDSGTAHLLLGGLSAVF